MLTSVPVLTPHLLASFRALSTGGACEVSGLLACLEEMSAFTLLRYTSLASARPLLSFDMIKRTNGKDAPKYERCKDGDRLLFSAIDSAINAAFYWSQGGKQEGGSRARVISLNIPVCVLSLPFWDVCIDEGTVSEPEIRHYGHQTLAYPATPDPRLVTTFIWSEEALGSLVAALDDLLIWFHSQVQEPMLAGLLSHAP
jgi:hypothetical protein